MRILHTADWHLCDRLGRIDRTDDLRRAIGRVAAYCDSERADVLLVAGDLFSEQARPDGLRDAIRHLRDTFAGFLTRGGTVLAVTGNHDNENFCQTLRHAMSLAAPDPTEIGPDLPPGRFYLFDEPAFARLADPGGGLAVQFILMPYPSAARYLTHEVQQRAASLEQKNQFLRAAFTAKLDDLTARPPFDPRQPAVLAAHVSVSGAQVGRLFRISEDDDITVAADQMFGRRFCYVALGHIHNPQALNGLDHVRYSGSIEAMDLGESDDRKGLVRFDVSANGLAGPPTVLPLESTPIYAVDVLDPRAEIPTLATRYADRERALVKLSVRYTAGVDQLEQVLRELAAIFPRYYHRDWSESGALGASLTPVADDSSKKFEDVVRDYLKSELAHHSEPERDAVLNLAEALLVEP